MAESCSIRSSEVTLCDDVATSRRWRGVPRHVRMAAMVSGNATETATLAVALGDWELTPGGGRIWIAAHAYHEDQGDYVFSALMKGTPNYEVEVARVPKAIVVRIEGG
jgi:hypothetical protein